MSVVVPLPIGYGWVVLSGVASIFTQIILGGLVGKARKKYGVDYPHMYDNTKPAFNAVQRGHQNMLETHYAELWLSSIAGLRYPTVTAVASVAWTIGRILYAVGYTSGDVKKRGYGSIIAYPALTVLTVTASMTALQLLGYINA